MGWWSSNWSASNWDASNWFAGADSGDIYVSLGTITLGISPAEPELLFAIELSSPVIFVEVGMIDPSISGVAEISVTIDPIELQIDAEDMTISAVRRAKLMAMCEIVAGPAFMTAKGS